MVTLASILVAVPLGVAGGLLTGIGAYHWPRFEKVLTPLLDLMQTIPVFAYLVPILFLFGFGPTAAVVATMIYAMPPMIRITVLALHSVPDEIRDLGKMIGCTRRQMTWRVMVPAIKDSLMVGVNQVIMLSLNMVIIASMIGAGGLGFDVLAALRRLDIGAGLESGLAISGAGDRPRSAKPGLCERSQSYRPRRCAGQSGSALSLYADCAHAGHRDRRRRALDPCGRSPIQRRSNFRPVRSFPMSSPGSMSTSSTRLKRSRTPCF